MSDTSPAPRGLSAPDAARQVFDETLGRAALALLAPGRAIVFINAQVIVADGGITGLPLR